MSQDFGGRSRSWSILLSPLLALLLGGLARADQPEPAAGQAPPGHRHGRAPGGAAPLRGRARELGLSGWPAEGLAELNAAQRLSPE